MQAIPQADLSHTVAAETQAESTAKTAPIELSLDALVQVAGGLSPNGSWATTTQSPNGSW